MIRHAIVEKGCKNIIIGLGGSSTTDGGAGMACALGVKFFDEHGKDFTPVGGTLENISRIDMSGLEQKLRECTILGMCDVDNPLYGKNGVAKGRPQNSHAENVILLDVTETPVDLIKRDLNMDIANVPGSGAAGGLGAGMLAF